MKTCALLFALMFLNYGLNAINFRMVARGSYLGTAWSDAVIAVLGFTLIRQVAATETLLAQVGYVAGGMCGSMLGLYLTRTGPDADGDRRPRLVHGPRPHADRAAHHPE